MYSESTAEARIHPLVATPLVIAKAWIRDRLEVFAGAFAIDALDCAELSNHLE